MGCAPISVTAIAIPIHPTEKNHNPNRIRNGEINCRCEWTINPNYSFVKSMREVVRWNKLANNIFGKINSSEMYFSYSFRAEKLEKTYKRDTIMELFVA